MSEKVKAYMAPMLILIVAGIAGWFTAGFLIGNEDRDKEVFPPSSTLHGMVRDAYNGNETWGAFYIWDEGKAVIEWTDGDGISSRAWFDRISSSDPRSRYGESIEKRLECVKESWGQDATPPSGVFSGDCLGCGGE